MLNEITSTSGSLQTKGIGRFTAEQLSKELHYIDSEEIYVVKRVTDDKLGQQVRTARELQGLRASEVADYLGISYAYMSLLENGTALPKNKGMNILGLVNFETP